MSVPNESAMPDVVVPFGCSDHVCVVYRRPEEQFASIVTWLRHGIERAERCVCIADESEIGVIQSALSSRGIVHSSGLGQGVLVFAANAAEFTRSQRSQSALFAFLDDVCAEATLLGAKNLWLASEMTWVLDSGLGDNPLLQYENWLSCVTTLQLRALCQFNLERFGPELMSDVFRIHPHIVFEGKSYQNAKFESLRDRLYTTDDDRPALTPRSDAAAGLTSRRSEVRHRPPNEWVPESTAVQVPARADFDDRQEHGSLSLLLESIPAGVLLTDEAGLITYANARAEAILKKTRRQLSEHEFGNQGWNLKNVLGQPVTDEWLPDSRVRKTGLANFDTRLAIEWSHDSRTYVSINAAPLGYSKGRPRGAILLITDISESVAAEVEHQRVKMQSFQSQRMEAIATLAGGVAHDFNNLLGGILACTSYMDLELGEGFRFHEDLSEIKALVERGAELTRQLLGFAHRGKYVPTQLDLNAIVTELSASFGRTRKDIEIHFSSASDNAFVSGDKSQIQQLLVNLLLNSRQAMANGGTITLRTEAVMFAKTDVVGHGVAPGRYIRLTVSDTGVGMSEGTRQRVFEPFFTTGQLGQGTGLGLASVFGIVKNHGGFITVQSELGKGATFTVHLPATKRLSQNQPMRAPARQREKGTILVVDDEPYILRSSQRLLKAMGYPVLTAKGGREAIEVFKRSTKAVDLVILDMTMPDMSGTDTFEALRAIDPEIKVLLCSGYSSDGEAGEILRRGCSGFIQKPFDSATLSAKLVEVM